MDVMRIEEDIQIVVLSLVAGILHLGNVTFQEDGNYASVINDDCEY